MLMVMPISDMLLAVGCLRGPAHTQGFVATGGNICKPVCYSTQHAVIKQRWLHVAVQECLILNPGVLLSNRNNGSAGCSVAASRSGCTNCNAAWFLHLDYTTLVSFRCIHGQVVIVCDLGSHRWNNYI
jgi:hypothetical protein